VLLVISKILLSREVMATGHVIDDFESIAEEGSRKEKYTTVSH
jgi:hypothetical protein